MMRCWMTVAIVYTALTLSWAEIYSSTAHLERLLQVEQHLVTALHEYIDRTESKLLQARQYLDNFYDSIQGSRDIKVTTLRDNVVYSPLQTYQLVRRLSVEWDILERDMSSDDWSAVNNLMRRYQQMMPNQDDLMGAALALVRLQDIYQLDMSDMANGDIMGVPQGASLNARDMLYMGKQAYNYKYYAHAIRWLEEALSQARLEGNRTASYNEIAVFYKSAVNTHDKLFERTDIDTKDFDTFVQPLRGDTSVNKSIASTGKIVTVGDDVTTEDDISNYLSLCRGEVLRSSMEESKLSCYLETRNNPYLLLQPIKVEVKGFDPYIFHFHDLLSDSQADLLRQIAEPELDRSMVISFNGSLETTMVRTSQSAWLDGYKSPLVVRVRKLVEVVTGLSADEDNFHAEALQIANYGIGGHYSPHHDYYMDDMDPEMLENLNPEQIKAGDRLATFMFYLSDVVKGGATVFPRVGASISPKKGSAVFWYNLKRNGSGNERSMHGSCPVVYGTKWIANIWFREIGQAFLRPCTLDPNM